MYEKGPDGNMTGGYLLGEIVRRMHRAKEGEMKERLVVMVAAPETVSGLLRALEVPL
eukprot:CAMPEP_0196577316 /NCGR_PEP_ID=MMETSP1081-20130531/6398_1 /TAXON_ID=36882 /ORGANISM="Pyramimonas amylifera, Strain CCMP720" /LENGTH=56 /DNA_ID=CAMNT_0041896203 /DNA_START=68 /DNA_END=235 /DNA_ORIENTATION=+